MSRSFFDVIINGQGTVYALPSTGTITIGAAPLADIRVPGDDAQLRFNADTRIFEVLGQGVRFGTDEAQPGQRWPAEVGEVVTVGLNASLVFVAWQQSLTRIVQTHDYFEQRAAEECLRAARRKSTFSIINVRVRAPVSTPDIENALASSIRVTDALSHYAPGIYELIIFDTDPAGAELVVGRIRRVLEQLGARCAVGAAHFPKEGLTVDELGERAAQTAIGSGQDPIEDSIGVAVVGTTDLVRRVSLSELNVLILGETGSGKEVLAARVHRASPREKKPFLKLNCAAFTEALLESELFGHEKGAFTGAHATKAGLLETAEGGTVFLDEIGEMPLSMQAKLLRVLEERAVLRVGGLKTRPIDVRFIAATNRDLELEISNGRFRADLYFRLDGATLVVPPLRERLIEFDSIANDLLRDACKKMSRAKVPTLTQNALAALKRYHWPGNIRELRNMLERAVMLADGDEIHRRHLPMEKLSSRFAAVRPPAGPTRPPAYVPAAPPPAEPPSAPVVPPPMHTMAPARAPLPASSPPSNRPRTRGLGLLATAAERAELEASERAAIDEALRQAAGNQSRAAELLGISRRTLIKRIEAYNLPRPRKR